MKRAYTRTRKATVSKIKKKRAPKIIDVSPVEVETTALVVRPRVRQSVPNPETARIPPRGEISPYLDPTGRLDIAAYRLAVEHLLPAVERRTGIAGIAELCAPWVEHFIAENVPGKNIFKAPKPRRRLK